MKTNNKCKNIFFLSFCFAIVLIAFLIPNISFAATEDGYKYLSDEDINPTSVKVGWDIFRKDQINGNGKISVKVEGAYYSFDRGLWAHASSTIIYDLRAYNYDYFTAYLGLNQTASSSSNGVIFKIYTSKDGTNWNIKHNKSSRPGENADFVKIDIKTEKYLKLEADANGSNGSDHSVYADTKLIKEGYQEVGEELVPSIEELDTKIKAFVNSNANIETNPEYKLTLLKRELISRVGPYALRRFYLANDVNKATYEWLTGDVKVLEYFILGGEPEGGYYNTLTQLARLYDAYKEDFKITQTTKYGTVLGDLYTRMAIAMSLTHSQNIGLWLQSGGENKSDALIRYQIYKDMHKNGNFVVLRNADGTPQLNQDGTPKLDVTQWFENYTIEEMRYIFNNLSDDEETLWLNEYTQSFVDQNQNNYGRYISPHPYMDYRWENLGQPEFYDPNRKEEWDTHFKGLFSKYNVTYRTGLKKIWMLFRNPIVQTGAVCGGISKVGSSVRTSHGIPCVVIGQPGHAAMIYYWQDANGRGYWNLDNDVSGWQLSEKGERLPLGWGNAGLYYARGSYQVVYVQLAQEALNDYESLVKCEEKVMLAKVYAGNLKEQERIYEEALEIQSINVDAWLGLINVYNSNTNKTENDYYNLAEKIAKNLKYYPLPMQQLTNLIKPKLTSIENLYKFTLLQTRILNEAKNLPNNTADKFTVMQPSLTRLEANYLLGKMDTTIATFSFDGDDAGKIVLASRFDGSGVRWDYCIDGNPMGEKDAENQSKNWIKVDFSAEEEHKLQLTPEQIASITAEDDIYVHIVGVNYDKNNLYKIDITTSTLPTLYNNDLENRIIGATNVMQWRLNDDDEWTSYSEAPDLTGDKTVEIRVGATGTTLPSTSRKYAFTEDNQPDTRKYIPLSRISLHSFSSEATGGGQYGNVTNALDGNINTRWHSDWNGNDRQRFITVELNKLTYISAVEYVPAGSGNGCVSAGKLYVSTDGEKWTEVATFSGWGNNGNTKVINLPKAKEAKYVKFQATSNYGDGRTFISAKMFNFFEDVTKIAVADFSLDGEEAGKIKIREEYKDLSWQYSIDGTTWKNTTSSTHILNQEELDTLTEENDIKIKFAGNDTEYYIDLDKKVYDETPYANDWENRLIGIKNSSELEWKIDDGNWKLYTEEEPVVTGNKILYVRKKASEQYLASDIAQYQFTDDNQSNDKKYIPIEHLSVHAFVSETNDATRPFYAINAIDGNINTMWHTAFNQHLVNEGKKAFFTIKLDEPKYISALEFIHRKYRDLDPSFPKTCKVFTSMDGEEWIECGKVENLSQEDNIWRTIECDSNVKGQYVKLEIETYDMFASAVMINLYEDTTAVTAATFELTGENAKKIVLLQEFKDKKWKYSLDSKQTWTNVNGGDHALTDEEIERLNPEDKIIIAFEGLDKEYVLYVQKPEAPERAYVNDLENRLIGITNTDTLEWKIEGESSWKSYVEEEPVVQGTKKLLVRTKAKGINLPSDPVEYNFTEDNQEATRKYIPISKLTIAGFSAEDKGQSGAASNAIDGNYNTRWLNSSAGTDNEKYIVVKFDSAVYLSAMDYVPHAENGKILSGKILGSMDGENFTEIAQISNWQNNQNTKTIDFSDSVKVRYVKIIGEETSYTGAKRHVGARMFNFYEDTTKKQVVIPTAQVQYSTTTKTNQDVVATLVNPSTQIIILNNNGSSEYTFTENGTFIFEFEDNEGNKGTATANVDWICKTLPEAIFEYDITTPTNKDVTVTVKFKVNGEFSNEVTILNNEGSNEYTFSESGEFTFRFRGPYGNEGTATAKVYWLHKTLPEAIFEYDTTEITNQPVKVTVKFKVKGELSNEVTILNNEGSNEYIFTESGEFTFKFRGPYGNEGMATAKVDWIDTTIPVATITYSTTSLTNQDVIATLTSEDNITITNNGGSNTYTFSEDGEFTFEFVNELGNEGTATAKVNWIDKVPPTPTISYSIMEPTNGEVVATISFDKENVTVEGGNTCSFIENGTFIFEYVDEAGNTGTAEAKVDWIDKTLPVATITYSTTSLTNQDVIATISFEDGSDVTVEGGNTHTFTQNGIYAFNFTTSTGKKGIAKANVTWIDKVPPTPTMVYSTIEPTTENVIAGITFDKENVRIVNNNGERTYTFTQNETFTFEYMDEAGNTGRVNAVVNWIDRTAPTAEIEYDITEKTNGNVVAKLVNASEDIIITNNNGSNTRTFSENGRYTFEFKDLAGNKGTAVANVTWIDRNLPVATITYSTTSLTNQDVIATISFNKENVTVEGGNTHTFTTNGEYVFEYVDESGNTSMTTATVNWIDKIAPTAQINYSITTPTNQDVVVTLVDESEPITITNNNGSKTYTFTQNNTFTFEFVDAAGNEGTATATVSNIDKEVPVATITYSTEEPTTGEVIATITFDKENVTVVGGNTHVFTTNEEYTFEFEDEAGNKGTAIAKVDWIEKNPDAPVILGDVDGDGELTVNDLALMKLHLIDIIELKDNRLKAADINGNGVVDITDIARLKLMLLDLDI